MKLIVVSSPLHVFFNLVSKYFIKILCVCVNFCSLLKLVCSVFVLRQGLTLQTILVLNTQRLPASFSWNMGSKYFTTLNLICSSLTLSLPV